MRKPNWAKPRDGWCQWPRCRQDGVIHYSHRANAWIDVKDGVDLCDNHLRKLNEGLWPDEEISVEDNQGQ